MSSEHASVTRHTSEHGDEPVLREYTRKVKAAASEERQSSARPIPLRVCGVWPLGATFCPRLLHGSRGSTILRMGWPTNEPGRLRLHQVLAE